MNRLVRLFIGILVLVIVFLCGLISTAVYGYWPFSRPMFVAVRPTVTPTTMAAAPTATATAQAPVATSIAPAPTSTAPVYPTAIAQVPTQVAPEADGPADTSYSISGDTVTVNASAGQTIATIRFLTTVDNMPTEWLKNRPVAYLYQSGIGNPVELEITLFEGGAFAMDGDWATAGGTDLGVVDDGSDFLLFADQPGTYRVTASSFGLAIGTYNGTEDKAGNVIQDRRNATGWDGRPAFYLNPDGIVDQL